MPDPEWLVIARREGRVLSETGVQQPALTPTASTPPSAPAKAKAKRKPAVTTGGGLRWSVELLLPCRVVSEANRRDHWSAAMKRKKAQADVLRTAYASLGLTLPLPVVVTWVHVRKHGVREQDDDNLRRSFKGLRDAMAALLGADDADPRIVWLYEQEVGKPGVKLRIESQLQGATAC